MYLHRCLILRVIYVCCCVSIFGWAFKGQMKEIPSSGVRGVAAVLSTIGNHVCSASFLFDSKTSSVATFLDSDEVLTASGVGVFEVVTDDHTNATQTQLAEVIPLARQLRKASQCVTVVVVSDNPDFLAAFAEWSFNHQLMVWSSKLIIFTRLPLARLQHLDSLLLKTNSIIYTDTSQKGMQRGKVYAVLPHTLQSTNYLHVASWTDHTGLTITSQASLFPDKYNRFLEAPSLVVAAEEYQPHIALTSDGQDGHVLSFTGPMVNLVDLLAESLNFSYSFKRPPDGSWGTKRSDGSWSGMVGMVLRKEADVGVGPFAMISSRAEVIDYFRYIFLDYLKIVGGRGSLEVDAWNFAHPFVPQVWLGILLCLVLLEALLLLLPMCLSLGVQQYCPFDLIHILLQQTATESSIWFWWERMVVGMWMLMTLVLTRSYAGNLMSLLAVRHIPQPYQTLRDVLDDPAVTMIWEADTAYVQYIFTVTSGAFREVAESGRTVFQHATQFPDSMDKLIRPGGHVLVIEDLTAKVFMAQDFTKEGRCDFYTSRDTFLPYIFAMITEKHSPVTHSINQRMRVVTECGLYKHWLESAIPNSTTCSTAPSTTTVTSPLSLANIAGMTVVLGVGCVTSLLIFGTELVIHRCSQR